MSAGAGRAPCTDDPALSPEMALTRGDLLGLGVVGALSTIKDRSPVAKLSRGKLRRKCYFTSQVSPP